MMSSSADNAASVAALPTSQVDVSLPPVTGRTINVAAGGDLQAAINSAQPGDQIVLAAGATFTGSYTLPNKTGAGWVTIRSSGTLPAEGVRATAADAGAMATLMAPGSNAPALQTAPGAHNYRIIGLNITAAPSVTQMTSLVNLGSGNADQNTLTSQPQNIVIDRSYIHGSDTLDLQRGVALNSANSAIINSTITDVHSKDSDSQAIAGWNGTGPYLIQNNDLEASGENIMFGGADPSIPNALPSDITIRGNDITKPASWQGVWEVKNLLELKLGQRVLIEDNNLSNNWADAQDGTAINIKSTDQDGTAPWSNTSDVTIRNNIIANTPSGIKISASPDPGTTVPASDINVYGNTFNNVGGTTSTNPTGALFQLLGYGGALNNITITGNTAVQGDGNLASTVILDGTPTQGLNFSNNTLTQGLYGIKGSGSAEGAGSLATFAPGAIFTGNTLIGGTASDYGNLAALNSFSLPESLPSVPAISPSGPVTSPPTSVTSSSTSGTITADPGTAPSPTQLTTAPGHAPILSVGLDTTTALPSAAQAISSTSKAASSLTSSAPSAATEPLASTPMIPVPVMTSVTMNANGSSTVNVESSGQLLTSSWYDVFLNHGIPNNTFVFQPGYECDIITQFRVHGTDHDSLSFQGSDFNFSIASVLHNTKMNHGSAVIMDPTSGDRIRVTGITKQQLTANKGDFTFHM